VRSGAYRVNFRDGNETTAYYTDHLEDADALASSIGTRSQAFSTAIPEDGTGIRDWVPLSQR
jgi:hypothetical protein